MFNEKKIGFEAIYSCWTNKTICDLWRPVHKNNLSRFNIKGL